MNKELLQPTPDADLPANHEYAAQYAAMHPESNLARCYLALAGIVQPVQPEVGQSDPVAWLNPYGGVLQTRATGHEKEHFTIPLFTHLEPTLEPFTIAQKNAMFDWACTIRQIDYESYLQGIEDCEAARQLQLKETK